MKPNNNFEKQINEIDNNDIFWA
ncbi:hypothetical protein [Cohnella sp. WQ 127256]